MLNVSTMGFLLMLGALCLASPRMAAAQEAGASPMADLPERTGHVMDLAGVVDDESRGRMEAIASEVRTKSKGDIVVVVFRTLDGTRPDSVAAIVSQAWEVGFRGEPDDPATDTGVLILLSLEEREFSIQVQDGMRSFFPEAAIRDLVTSKVVRPFRAGDYGVGLVEAVRGVAQVFAQRFAFELETGP